MPSMAAWVCATNPTKNMRIIQRWLFSVTVTLLASSTGFVLAGDDAEVPQNRQHATHITAVTLDELAQARGQGGVINVTQLTNAQLNANLNDNVAIGNATGNNFIDDSFSRASGLFSIIQNTGNNVIIQDSIIVNVTIFP